MKRALVLCLVVALLAGLIAWATATLQHRSRLAAAERTVMTEIEMQRVALHLADIARQSDRASVIVFTADGTQVTTRADVGWLSRLSNLLRESPYHSLPASFLGQPIFAIELYTEDHLLARLNIHDGALGITGPQLSGLFRVGQETKAKLHDLVRENPPTP
jgi:hypothetical protein